jgi:hypothetical protein
MPKPKFATGYNRPVTASSPCGNEEEPVYEFRLNSETGVKELEEVKKVNVYEKIQSVRAGTSIAEMVERYERGDISAISNNLSASKAVYGDFTNAPKTLMEAQNTLIKAEKYWGRLPVEVRNDFGTYENFLASIDNGDYETIFNKYTEKNSQSSGKSASSVSQSGAGTEANPTVGTANQGGNN